jgi:hypothetical protein
MRNCQRLQASSALKMLLSAGTEVWIGAEEGIVDCSEKNSEQK